MAKRGWIYTEKDVHREWLKKIEQGEIGREWYLLIFRKKLKIVISLFTMFFAENLKQSDR
jgi:hypothetical protein